MARLSGLGRGLGALIPADATAVVTGDQPRLEELPVGSIVPEPAPAPRALRRGDARRAGGVDPGDRRAAAGAGAARRGRTRYELIAGERRWRAARRAGLAAIPAIVRTTDDLGSVEQALVENLHRQDLTPLEEAAAYQQLIEDFGLTHEQVATRVGKSRSAVTNTLRLLSLPPAIQHLLADGGCRAGHAKALLGTPDRAFQEQLARRAVAEGWSVRMLEEAVQRPWRREPRRRPTHADRAGDRAEAADGAGLTGATRLRPPGLLELEELLADHLSTRVSVTMGAQQGQGR